jgi:hypothetical protein
MPFYHLVDVPACPAAHLYDRISKFRGSPEFKHSASCTTIEWNRPNLLLRLELAEPCDRECVFCIHVCTRRELATRFPVDGLVDLCFAYLAYPGPGDPIPTAADGSVDWTRVRAYHRYHSPRRLVRVGPATVSPVFVYTVFHCSLMQLLQSVAAGPPTSGAFEACSFGVVPPPEVVWMARILNLALDQFLSRAEDQQSVLLPHERESYESTVTIVRHEDRRGWMRFVRVPGDTPRLVDVRVEARPGQSGTWSFQDPFKECPEIVALDARTRESLREYAWDPVAVFRSNYRVYLFYFGDQVSTEDCAAYRLAERFPLGIE